MIEIFRYVHARTRKASLECSPTNNNVNYYILTKKNEFSSFFMIFVNYLFSFKVCFYWGF